jgi:ABC-type dipeptide/oligopeptide/nickel transport system ATPase subunit
MNNGHLFKISGLSKTFTKGVLGLGKKRIYALKNLNLHIKEGEILGIIGRSGAGKSTLAKILAGVLSFEEGTITYENRAINSLGRHGKKKYWQKVQYLFQDVYGALTPHKTVKDTILEPIKNFKIVPEREYAKRLEELITKVKLGDEHLLRLPRNLSGGERQRVNIARCLAVNPKVLIADEPVAHLDLINQFSILSIFASLNKKSGITIILITHDLRIIASLCNRVVVIEKGEIVDVRETKSLISAQLTPVENKLLESTKKLGLLKTEFISTS